MRRALAESPTIRTDLRGRAHDIVEYLAFGAVTRVRGGGSGIEAEFTYLMTNSAYQLDQLVAQRAELAYEPGGTFSVTVDVKAYFRGGDGRYYRTEAAARGGGGQVTEVKFAMPEFVSSVTRTFPGEFAYQDHQSVFAALARLEQILANLPGEAGSPPHIPLSEVLRPEDGFELTDVGKHTFIGPRPVGDWPGAHVHHTFGVPLTGLYLFLEHVRDHTWRDESRGYLTRAHLDDGLEFGSQVAFGFLMASHFPDGDLPPDFSAEDELARRSASEPAVAQLRGYVALMYTGAATVAHNLIDKRLNKAHAAVLARHDMGQILSVLPPEVRDYLGRNADDVISRFERSFRNRIPDYDDQFRARWFDQEDGGGPATINLLRPPMDWARGQFGLPLSPANYLLGGLDPARAPEIPQQTYMGMFTQPGLDAQHEENLGFALVVLEVRSYGARHVSARDAQVQHERLAAVVRELVGVRPGDGTHLLRNLTDPAVEVTEDELISWMVRDSAVPASLEPEPGDSERSFGLEIEFVFEEGLTAADKDLRLQRIIGDLRRFGLTEQTGIGGYRSAQKAGYTSQRSGWHLEHDTTVHGEVVSPILPYRDGTEAERQRVWRDIALVLGVLRRHGAGNGSRVGGHVHIGVGDYERDVERMLGLISLFRVHQDTLYRLAATPGETFRRLAEAAPLPEPAPQRDAYGRWEWPEFGYSDSNALNLSPLHSDYLDGNRAEDDHVEVRIFDGFLDRRLGLGGVRARVEVIRALADAALERSRPAAGRPSELGDSFLIQDPDMVANATALGRILGLFPGSAGRARERVSRRWELTRWQPAADWPRFYGQVLWPAEVLPSEQWDEFGEVAAGHPDRPVFMYVDSRPREELLRMALDRRPGPADGAARGIVVAIVTGPRASHLDPVAARYGVLLVRPAVPAKGQWPQPRSAELDGVTGWHSDTGWLLVGRGASGATTKVALGSFFGPQQLEQVLLTGKLTPYQAERLSGRRIVQRLAGDRPVAVALLARLAGREDGPDGLREAIAQALSLDLSRPDSRYAAFLPAGQHRERTVAQIKTKWYLYDGTAELAIRVATDVLERPITVIGPDAASSAVHGRDWPGQPIELIPLTGRSSLGRYLAAEPPAPEWGASADDVIRRGRSGPQP